MIGFTKMIPFKGVTHGWGTEGMGGISRIREVWIGRTSRGLVEISSEEPLAMT